MTFGEFWKAFPRRVGKLAALKAWDKALRISEPEEIIAGIQPYIRNKPDYADFCHPATFLNQGRWLDEYEDVRVKMRKVDDEVYKVYLLENGLHNIAETGPSHQAWAGMVPDEWQPSNVIGIRAG